MSAQKHRDLLDIIKLTLAMDVTPYKKEPRQPASRVKKTINDFRCKSWFESASVFKAQLITSDLAAHECWL